MSTGRVMHVIRRMIRDARWPTLVAIPVLALATWRDWIWIWGLVFVFWAIRGLRSGDAFLVELVNRRENPILYWLITVAWLAFGVYYVVADGCAQLGWCDTAWQPYQDWY